MTNFDVLNVAADYFEVAEPENALGLMMRPLFREIISDLFSFFEQVGKLKKKKM